MPSHTGIRPASRHFVAGHFLCGVLNAKLVCQLTLGLISCAASACQKSNAHLNLTKSDLLSSRQFREKHCHQQNNIASDPMHMFNNRTCHAGMAPTAPHERAAPQTCGTTYQFANPACRRCYCPPSGWAPPNDKCFTCQEEKQGQTRE